MTFGATDIVRLVLGIVFGALVLCLLLVFAFNKTPRARFRGAMKVIGVFALGLAGAYYVVVAGPEKIAQKEAAKIGERSQQDYQERYAKAKALFDERCKTAEERIYRTVDGVEGVLLLSVRAADTPGRAFDKNWPDAGLPQQFGGDSYIRSFIAWEHQASPSERGSLTSHSDDLNGYVVKSGYSYVDVKEGDEFYRYRFINSQSPDMSREKLNVEPARYSVSFNNIEAPSDRDYWVAGTTVVISDRKTQEVIATKTWYSFEPGLGSEAGNRQPWLFASTCPGIRGEAKRSPTRFFVDQVLKPKQGN